MLGDKFIIGGGKLYNLIFSEYLLVIDKIYETNINYFIKSNQLHYGNILVDK